MLRAAGIRSEGPDGQLRAAGLGTVYASVYRTWLGDDDPGLAKTMAALDRRLRRGERTLQSLDEAASKFCGFANRCAEAARKRTKPAGAETPRPTRALPFPPARFPKAATADFRRHNPSPGSDRRSLPTSPYGRG